MPISAYAQFLAFMTQCFMDSCGLIVCQVIEGDFPLAERIMQEAVEEGLLDQHTQSQPVEARWTQVEPLHPSSQQGGSVCDSKLMSGSASLPRLPADITGSWPGMRGGHSMCVDTRNGKEWGVGWVGQWVGGALGGWGLMGDYWLWILVYCSQRCCMYLEGLTGRKSWATSGGLTPAAPAGFKYAVTLESW